MSPPARSVVNSQQSVVSMEVTVNGQTRRISEGTTLVDLIRDLGLRQELVAVEINRELVRRSAFTGRMLQDGDRIEVVEFVGGG